MINSSHFNRCVHLQVVRSGPNSHLNLVLHRKLHIVKDVVVVKLFSSIRPVIHPWMVSYREENPGINK
jgi:hypothetical protein